MPAGGSRPGAGRPDGAKDSPTALRQLLKGRKLAARQRLTEQVIAQLDGMVKAQAAHAQGVSYMVLRNPDGTFTRATNEQEIDRACAQGAEGFHIFTQAPNTNAFVALTNQALDKPTEHHELTGEDGGPIQIADRLNAARKRLAAREDTPS
jgi:hypothetical protein